MFGGERSCETRFVRGLAVARSLLTSPKIVLASSVDAVDRWFCGAFVRLFYSSSCWQVRLVANLVRGVSFVLSIRQGER